VSLVSGLATIAAALVLGMIVGVTADVVVRNVFGRTIRGMDELSEYALYLICLLPAPWIAWQRQHIRIDLVLHFMSGRTLARVESTLDLLSVSTCGLFAVLSGWLVANSARAGTMIYKSFTFPEWWLYAPLPIIMCLMAIVFAIQAIDRLAGRQASQFSSATEGP
jgi:TRAP-type C4-dicarboxylate transport system permease small subunit